MPSIIDADGPRAASHLHMFTHLTGPFRGGARDDELVVDTAGRVRVRAARQPLVLAAPRHTLAGQRLRLHSTRQADGAGLAVPVLQFAPYSEAGSFLPLLVPDTDPATGTSLASTLQLELVEVDAAGAERPLPASQIADEIQLHLVEGIFGRLTYALGAEKQRLRREARELVAMRALAAARDNALDRFGVELGVPRLFDELVIQAGQIQTRPRREPDTEYRTRLALYRPLAQATPRQVRMLLNGPGDGAGNNGLLARLGLTHRFDVVEADNSFAVAIHLVSTENAKPRDDFVRFVREAFLLWPQSTPQANSIHAARYLPQELRTAQDRLRADLRAAFTFTGNAATDPAFAVTLAEALRRVAQCRRALGGAGMLTISRAQRAADGSRYELGLGVDLAAIPAAELDRLAQAHADPTRATADPATEALLRSLTPRPSAQDPDGRWLLEGCGLHTVHRIGPATVYLSHLPSFGLVITGANGGAAAGQVATGLELPLEARYQASGDPGGNQALVAGVAAAKAAWERTGAEVFTVLDVAGGDAELSALRALSPNDPAARVITQARLPLVANLAQTTAELRRLPRELYAVLRLGPLLSAGVLAGDASRAAQLRALADLLGAEEMASALPLVTTAGRVVLVVGVIGLPGAGLNLSERAATGFRWYAVPVQGLGGRLGSVGSRSSYVPDGPGLVAVVVLGFVRHGLADPYEFRVQLPDGALLDVHQYEFLMNLLERGHPAGVKVSTAAIRRDHVDLDGDGIADPLLRAPSRTFRRFVRKQRDEGQEAQP
jgi:hypothetical protein